ncbi:CRISPR-associated protein Cas4 [Olavius algarvensis spirochete endosymbiont]|uniref:CRISPR-associated protein Cas4 n=1 Tax=Olavius algarvensis spirochete endosymbiont TaxID=260710 RepID=UPI000F51AB02|nr:CRISPR-associated protein Cas4 [Olavius algarvensis spirochete endosymbiont]
MPYSEEEFIMLSSLQHYTFCPRRCALIHKDQCWAENYLTVKGDLFHSRVDSYPIEKRKGFRTEFSMPICSSELGIVGKADVVEIRYQGKEIREVYPVEYKSGKPKHSTGNEVQLCAQVLCLEEMMGISIEIGYLYYGKDRRRIPIEMSQNLREEVAHTTHSIHQMLREEQLPPPIKKPHCKSCSLKEECQPNLSAKPRAVRSWINRILDKEGGAL